MKFLFLVLVALVVVVSLEATPVKVATKQNNEQYQAVKGASITTGGKGKKDAKAKHTTGAHEGESEVTGSSEASAEHGHGHKEEAKHEHGHKEEGKHGHKEEGKHEEGEKAEHSGIHWFKLNDCLTIL